MTNLEDVLVKLHSEEIYKNSSEFFFKGKIKVRNGSSTIEH